jgi:hypothetical protein
MSISVSRSANFSKSSDIDMVNEYLDEVLEIIEGEIINIQVVKTASDDFRYWVFYRKNKDEKI